MSEDDGAVSTPYSARAEILRAHMPNIGGNTALLEKSQGK